MAERIDIGIDGGGTGCRVRIARSATVLSETTGGPANIVTDPAGAEAAIRSALEDGLTAAGLSTQNLTSARICAGLAGGRLPGVADAFAGRLPYLAYVVDDSVTALEGALAGADGTLASLGTGSFFIRRDADQRRHIGGWGFHLGDEGSAAWAGRQALRYTLQAEDGRRATDNLTAALMETCAPHPVQFARTAKPGEFAELLTLLWAHRDTGTARAVMADVLRALEDGLHAVGHRPSTPLVVTGGLGDRIGALLPEGLQADLRPAAGQALDGALRLAQSLP